MGHLGHLGHLGHRGVATPAALGVYKLRRPQASPLLRLVQDQLHRLQTVYDERVARIRCDACAHEYLLAFSCKGRYFCPSCHAKRLALCRDPHADR